MAASKKPLFSKPARVLFKTFVVLCISLVLIEILMTTFEPYLTTGLYQYDPDLGFRTRSYLRMPDGSVTNRFGFNARDYSLEKPPDVFRILVLSDSFNWAGGQNGNYTAVLERKLDALYGRHKVDVINSGYVGTHTGEELAILKKFGLQYHPDLVVLGFFVGNDFIDGDPYRKRIIVSDTYIDIDKRYEHRLLGRPIILKSRLLLFLRQKFRAWKERRALTREGPRGSGDQQKTFSRDTFLEIERDRLDFFSLAAAREKRYQPNIDYILQSLGEMDALLKSRGVKFMVAIFPDNFQIDPELLKAVLERYQLNAADYDIEAAQNLLRPFLEAKGIQYVDFLDRFRAVQPKELYRPQNTHWNDAGNQLAAEILLEALSRRSDIPKWPVSAPR